MAAVLLCFHVSLFERNQNGKKISNIKNGIFLLRQDMVVLFLIGKPIYCLEMVLGQFSSRNSVDVYDLAPAMRG